MKSYFENYHENKIKDKDNQYERRRTIKMVKTKIK